MTADHTVLLIGATGMLGSSILDELLRANLSTTVLMRPGKPEREEAIRARGLKIVHGDVMDPATLPAAFEGITTVVCSLNNNPEMFVPGHGHVIAAADEVGVSRVIPSDFSVDFFRIKPEENYNLAMRHEVAPLFEDRRVRPIHVLIGAFMDTMLDRQAPFIDWANGVLPYFGDGEQSCDFTSVADAGKFVAAACQDLAAPEVLRFAGDVITMPQLAEAVSAGTGTAVAARREGSVEKLAALITEKQKTAENPWAWIALQYHHNMVSGRAKFLRLDNDRYPHVKTESVADFSRRTRDDEVRGMSHSDVPRS
ncbi:NmrA family NAD(P)-binding protein [Mucisphaera calidilacus]|uniref:NAD(P)H azoreductase n=1 Tax=Mucisphaera calidilacus TaxID=2527982 RepID=A0A518BTZ2_9BACT|nr:NmrA family NAD(P)-binding protein [Mucisphaera calidilacus]QDU70452.1 NAD(P)H azoreductase [Mucisphaera calidilacus]